jgi:hypothetical protein
MGQGLKLFSTSIFLRLCRLLALSFLRSVIPFIRTNSTQETIVPQSSRVEMFLDDGMGSTIPAQPSLSTAYPGVSPGTFLAIVNLPCANVAKPP